MEAPLPEGGERLPQSQVAAPPPAKLDGAALRQGPHSRPRGPPPPRDAPPLQRHLPSDRSSAAAPSGAGSDPAAPPASSMAASSAAQRRGQTASERPPPEPASQPLPRACRLWPDRPAGPPLLPTLPTTGVSWRRVPPAFARRSCLTEAGGAAYDYRTPYPVLPGLPWKMTPHSLLLYHYHRGHHLSHNNCPSLEEAN